MNKTATVPAGTQYKEIRVKSTVPIWAAAAIWVTAALVMPMYKPSVIIITALVSLLTYAFASLLAPKKTIRERIPFTADDPVLEDVINRIDAAMDTISADSQKLFAAKPDVSDTMNEIVSLILKIREDILKNPEKLKKISRFLNYYLPTTVKICEKYVYLSSQHSEGENVTEAMRSIETALGQIKTAFVRQHDALFEGEALDLSAEAAVLEMLLKQDSLDNQ